MYRLQNGFKDSLRPRFALLYGDEHFDHLMERLALVADRYSHLCPRSNETKEVWDEKSCLLITYGDMIMDDKEAPLSVLSRFVVDYLKPEISDIHILPFFPYSSDDGFSVIDYRTVDQDLGSWDDIKTMGEDFGLMFDLVINHVSRQSNWFQDYLASIAPARNYFIEMEAGVDLSLVTRPRTSPLLSEAQTVSGTRYVWSTFSEDQIDLNYANPDLLLEMIDILLSYIHRGVRIIRLDAIAYLWKEVGTNCINLPQTHEIVKLLRDVVEYVAPGTVLLTETNLPHEENISYFGDGDEAHMVYQFSLPPLLLHTLQSGSAVHLTGWAAGLVPPSKGCTYLNFTASHDGIGVRPLEGLLDSVEIAALVDKVRECSGLVSSRVMGDGEEVPYELNITYFDALRQVNGEDDSELHIARFLCSQAIMLSLQGVPAIYFHSLFGSSNNLSGVEETGRNRVINRARFDDGFLREMIADEATVIGRVFKRYKELLNKRRSHPGFHPDVPQQVITCLEDNLFGLVRNVTNGDNLVCLFNVGATVHTIDLAVIGNYTNNNLNFFDMMAGKGVAETVRLGPYGFCWLTF